MKDIYILGIYQHHNSTAALFKNGEIIYVLSEERLRGIKNFTGFPSLAIKKIFEDAKITIDDIDKVAIVGLYGPAMLVRAIDKKIESFLDLIYYLAFSLNKIYINFQFISPFFQKIHRKIYPLAIKFFGNITQKRENKLIADILNLKDLTKIERIEHHLAHAASAYYASPFNNEDALVLTLDGEGDLLCATVNVTKNGFLERIAETSLDNSLGWLFFYVTRYLGMKGNEHEYKVMGLAPYAKAEGVDKVYEKIKDLVIINPENPLKFKAKFDMHHVYPWLKKNLEGFRFDNIAGAFQKLIEERMIEWVKNTIKLTGIKTVCLAGGLFMNVKANLKILELEEIERLFVMPSCSDESTPIGACYAVYAEFCRNWRERCQIKPLKDLYFGPAYSNKEIENFLRWEGYFEKYKITEYEDIEKKIAELLAKNKIIARFDGRMEFGARALGNRSILANPKNPESVRTINEQMKNRDFWMPFAGSILKEDEDKYILNPKKIAATFMIVTFHSTEKGKKELKAAMHPYDFTIRPQIIDEEINLKYWRLIKEFKNLTGIGGILNTSFNLHGYPIVMAPKDAMDAFENSGLEYLAIGTYLIEK